MRAPAMSAVEDVPSGGDSDFMEVVPLAPLAFNPTTAIPPNGRPVFRFPEQLRMHHALEELGWTGVIDELNYVARLEKQSEPESILITTNGTILAGFGRWKLALLEGEKEIPCIEYSRSEDEALQFILEHHQPSRGWNPFVRIRLALTLEPYLRQKALDNMRAGGKYKGSASLPDLEHIDVRQEIASVAGVGARNISNAKTILHTAHPRLIAALHESTLTINGAMKFCKLPRAKQLAQFIRFGEERAVNKVIRQSVHRPNKERFIPDIAKVLGALPKHEAQQPGSIIVRVCRLPHTVILVGQELLTGSLAQPELELK
jgi:hypothetical protein